MTSAFEGIDFQARTHALAWGRHNAPPKQKEYMRDLLAASDYPRLDIDQVAQLFKVRATSTRGTWKPGRRTGSATRSRAS